MRIQAVMPRALDCSVTTSRAANVIFSTVQARLEYNAFATSVWGWETSVSFFFFDFGYDRS